MSENELRQQADTINTMAWQLAKINKHLKYAPLYGVLGTLLSGAFAVGVFVTRYDISVVKQPQLASLKAQVMRGDSILNIRIDTTNKRIDNLPVLRFVNSTQYRDKYGNITYKNVN